MTAIDTEQPAMQRTRAELLAAAVAALTDAARLTSRDGEGRTEKGDWAEFVTHALAGAAANIGGIEKVLAGRPGSWEADYVRNLLMSTVGHGEEYLLEHRTEPVVVQLFVDEVLSDAGVWKTYEDAESELARRYDRIMPIPSAIPTEDQEREGDVVIELQDRLEEQRLRDWAEYGEALRVAVEAAAAELQGLSVPVVVHLDLHTWPAHDMSDWWGDVGHKLRVAAIESTPLPAPDPLRRVEGSGEQETSGHPA